MERSRRFALAGRASVVAGPALLVAILIGLVAFTPARTVFAVALAIGGMVLSGSPGNHRRAEARIDAGRGRAECRNRRSRARRPRRRIGLTRSSVLTRKGLGIEKGGSPRQPVRPEVVTHVFSAADHALLACGRIPYWLNRGAAQFDLRSENGRSSHETGVAAAVVGEFFRSDHMFAESARQLPGSEPVVISLGQFFPDEVAEIYRAALEKPALKSGYFEFFRIEDVIEKALVNAGRFGSASDIPLLRAWSIYPIWGASRYRPSGRLKKHPARWSCVPRASLSLDEVVRGILDQDSKVRQTGSPWEPEPGYTMCMARARGCGLRHC